MVDADCECVVWMNNQSIQMWVFVGKVRFETLFSWFAVLLFDGAIAWIHVAEDEMQFGIGAALVGTKHNRVWCFIVELNGEHRKYSVMMENWYIFQRKIDSWLMGWHNTSFKLFVPEPDESNLMYAPPHS